MNPAAGVEKRKVPRKLYDTLRAEEVPLLLAALKPHWRPVFATAVWTGLRKGELLGLRKSDVDMVAGTIAVRRSYDADTTKGGHADLIPIAAGLRPYLAEAMLSARGEYVFPDAEGRCKNCKPFDGTISATEVASAGRSAQPRVKTVRSPVRNESAAARRSSRVQPGPRTHR